MRSRLEAGITNIDISALVPHVGEGIVNRAFQGGNFTIPEKGLGRYSLPRTIGKIRGGEARPNTDPLSTKTERRQWNLGAHRGPRR